MFTGNHEATGGSFPTQIRMKAKQRFPENVKWLRFLQVALRNEALSRSKKHDGGSSEFWQVYFHRGGGRDGGGCDGTCCPRTVRAFAEVSSRRHQIAPFDASRTISSATFPQGPFGIVSEAIPKTCDSGLSSQVGLSVSYVRMAKGFFFCALAHPVRQLLRHGFHF